MLLITQNTQDLIGSHSFSQQCVASYAAKLSIESTQVSHNTAQHTACQLYYHQWLVENTALWSRGISQVMHNHYSIFHNHTASHNTQFIFTTLAHFIWASHKFTASHNSLAWSEHCTTHRISQHCTTHSYGHIINAQDYSISQYCNQGHYSISQGQSSWFHSLQHLRRYRLNTGHLLFQDC